MIAKSSALRRLTAAAGAVAVAVAGVITMGVASADPGPQQNGAPTKGSLTIHKRIGEETTQGDGTLLNPAPGQDISSIKGTDGEPLWAEFTLTQLGVTEDASCVPIDLTNTDNWDLIKKTPSAGGFAGDGFCSIAVEGPVRTGAEGVAKFEGLPLGFYHVEETDAHNDVVSKSAPFYLSIPYPNVDNNWLYDVNVYPKNQNIDAPTKTINPDTEQPGKGVVVGDVVEWTISQKVPALKAGETYTSATIWDYLNPEELEYVSSDNLKLNGDDLVAGTDYELDENGITWTLTGALDKINAGDTLSVSFTTKVLKVTATGDIANPGSDGPDKPGYGSEFNGKHVPGNPTPHTYWGQLELIKFDEGKKNKLKDAEFKVFLTDDANNCAAEAPTTGAVATGTSDGEGIVRWVNVTPDSPLGLWIANSADGEIANANKDYCLYETKAPAGYVAAKFDAKVNIKAGTNNKTSIEIENPKREGPDLPLTGGQGTLLMTIGGIVLMLAGAAAVYALRRRNQA